MQCTILGEDALMFSLLILLKTNRPYNKHFFNNVVVLYIHPSAILYSVVENSGCYSQMREDYLYCVLRIV